MAIWGYCPTCQRWFACPTWFEKDRPQPLCPVCLVEPRAIRNAASAPDGAYEAPAFTAGDPQGDGDADGSQLIDEAPGRVWGCCPRCRGWFAAHGWFDETVPLPACPRCKVPPNALRDDPPPSEERVKES